MSKRPMSDGCFFVIWGYLMVLSICLSPVLAAVIKHEIAETVRP